MNELIRVLNESFYTLSVFSLGASLVWGIMSVFLSPCHIASIPLIIGFVNNREKPDLKESFFLSLLFACGILCMLIVMGFITGFLGRILGDVGTPVMIIVYVFLIVCGFYLLDFPVFAKINLSFFKQTPKMNEMGAFTLGFFYGLILGPCSFAFLAPMIGIVFTQSTSQLWFGILLFIFYGLGHTTAIVIAGTAGSKIGAIFKSERLHNASLLIKRVCGSFIIIYAIYEISLKLCAI